ncbi:SURF1 family protein [Undibacterium sp. LX40W]|uniref:SURF1-like protein n=1 Tax=Undibacterium nitidum TaxID=2762298 RepID=A0A923HPX7_9BURK|nr:MULTISPECIES: SURF1 family protein [Undibacterium]MBC3882403.1 SURF1 family protein [Undibacterium nitidum]MBC3892684.1 SURF1 family protein [Undibacterium sp. LX40W]
MPKFKIPRALPLIATISVCVVGILLGNWQTRRAQEKEEIARQIEVQSKVPVQLANSVVLANVKAYQRLRLRGTFIQQWPLYLDNRPMNGKAGMYALMPFQISGSGETVLVERGWFQRDLKERTKIPPLSAPQGEIEIEGVVRSHIDRSMQLGANEILVPNAIVQNLSVSAVAEVLKVKMPEWVLEQTSDQGAGLQRDWPAPSNGADKHRAYAFQWYGLAAMAALFFVVTGIRRGKK